MPSMDRITTTAVRAGAGLVVLAAVLVSAWLAARHFGLLAYANPDQLRRLVDLARAWPWAAPAFVLTYAIAATLGLPATPLTLAGGALFGFGLGSLLNWIGATLGATGAYFLARMLGRDAVRRLLGSRASALDRVAGDGAFVSLVRLRLIPVVPFNALNFGAGIGGVRPWPYVASTALGIITGTVVYTYFADALIAGASGAGRDAFVQVAFAGALLVGLSFVPTLARRLGWVAAALAVVAGVGASAPAPALGQGLAPALAADHTPFSSMLESYVTDGLVDYDAFARDPRFGQYLRQLDQVNPAKLVTADRLAYWINVYNAYTIELINSRRERKSIRNINKFFGVAMKGPWTLPIVHAGGRTFTLDEVEHKIIRPEFKDPRVHAALVCAALGCPPLRSEAYIGSRVAEQLDDQVRRFLDQHAKNRVDIASRTVYASPIFTWYRDDFGGSTAGVAAFWSRYVPAGPALDVLRSGNITWRETAYDWSLNVRAQSREFTPEPGMPPRTTAGRQSRGPRS